MRTRLVVAMVVVALGVVATAGVAGAELDGSCEATGEFQRGTDGSGPFTVDARAVGDDTVVIPRSDSVAWTGSVASPPGRYSGAIAVDLPPPLGQVAIDTWEGATDATGNDGVEDYDLPDLVPSGVVFRVVGEHVDDAQQCSGHVNVRIEGGVADAPVALLVMVLLTAGAGFGLWTALRPLVGRAA